MKSTVELEMHHLPEIQRIKVIVINIFIKAPSGEQ
jgi:hypothetical protein